MHIVFSADDYSRAVTLRCSRRRFAVGLAIAAAAVAAAVYFTALHIARTWAQARDPIVAELVAQARADAEAERLVLWNQALEGIGEEIARLHVRLWQLSRLGREIAVELGLSDEAFPADESLLLGGDDGAAPEEKASSLTSELAVIARGVAGMEGKYAGLVGGFAARAVEESTIPNVEREQLISARSWRASGYGYRKDPFTGRRAFHAGYDYAARRGSPVLAAADGVVVHRGRLGNYGNALEIYHGDGVSTLYAHLDAYRASVPDFVKKGEIVAFVGSTGRSTGPHLHFELRLEGRPRPPRTAAEKLKAERRGGQN